MLRHGYATMLEKAGVSKFDAQHLLGHANRVSRHSLFFCVISSRQERHLFRNQLTKALTQVGAFLHTALYNI